MAKGNIAWSAVEADFTRSSPLLYAAQRLVADIPFAAGIVNFASGGSEIHRRFYVTVCAANGKQESQFLAQTV